MNNKEDFNEKQNENNIIPNDENVNSNLSKKEKTSKKNNKKIILIIISFLVGIILILGLYKIITSKKEVKKGLTESEYQEIVNLYGEAATLASKNYIIQNNGLVPTFEEIKENIVFSTHKVECLENTINYDGSVYLYRCKVDDEENYKHTYGELLNSGYATGEKIYIYKNEQVASDLITSETTKQTYYYFYNEKRDNQEYIGEYECESRICKIYDYSDILGKALINDNGYRLYDISTKKSQNIIIGDGSYSRMNFIGDETKLYGLNIENDDDMNAIYSLDSGKFITNFDYDYIGTSEYYSEKGCVYASKDKKLYAVNYLTGKEDSTPEKYSNIKKMIINNKVFYSVGPNTGNTTARRLVDSNFNSFANIPDDKDYAFVANSDGTITIRYYDENKYYIYDIFGNIVYTSKEYNSLLVLKDYSIITDENKNIKIIDLKEKEVVNLVQLTDKYTFFSLMSGWRTKDNKAAIYVVIEDKNIPFGTEGNGIEYYYVPSTGEKGSIKTKGYPHQ